MLAGLLTIIPAVTITLMLASVNVGSTQAFAAPAPPEPSGEADPAWEHLEALRIPLAPIDAARDHADLGESDEGCHIDQTTDIARTDCLSGDLDSDTTVVLYGDSHARHLLPTFDEIAKHRGWRLISATKSACPSIDVAKYNSNLERPYDECGRWREDLIDKLGDEGHIEMVIVSNARLDGDTLLLDEQGNELHQDDGLDAVHAAWGRGATRTFEQLATITDTIVVLRDTPWSAVDVPPCLAESETAEMCSFPLAPEMVANLGTHAAEVRVAPDNVSFIDPGPLVCSTDPCQVVTPDGIVKFRDDDHLTQTFARQLAPGLDALIPRS